MKFALHSKHKVFQGSCFIILSTLCRMAFQLYLKLSGFITQASWFVTNVKLTENFYVVKIYTCKHLYNLAIIRKNVSSSLWHLILELSGIKSGITGSFHCLQKLFITAWGNSLIVIEISLRIPFLLWHPSKNITWSEIVISFVQLLLQLHKIIIHSRVESVLELWNEQ